MRVDQFDFVLPEDRIALRPIHPREAARLLIVDPNQIVDGPVIRDATVGDLKDWLRPGDVLVLNNTRVIPAQLTGVRTSRGDTRPRISVTLHARENDNSWRAFAKPARKLDIGDRLLFGDSNRACDGAALEAEISSKGDGGEVTLRFELSGAMLDDAVKIVGVMPLPPYISKKRAVDAQDLRDYQTEFAEIEGAVAAPTAGLHLTKNQLRILTELGVQSHFVTLHVGAGTFLPFKGEDTAGHKMHAEWGEVSPGVAEAINQAKQAGGRLICVGTTSLRLIETATDDAGVIRPFSGYTDIFIEPGYHFKATDMLLTNFHLPRSTLFMLVAAFAGLKTAQTAYAHAIAAEYRFYSYGDACLFTRLKPDQPL